MTANLRILWHSNAPWAQSGYGVQTKHALNILSDLQHRGAPIEDIAVSAYWGLDGGKQSMSGRTVYGNPRRSDPWGAQAAPVWYKDFGANLLITLTDAWIMPPSFGHTMNWVPYYPVDHYPVPPAVVGHAGEAMARITMSQFGHDASEEVGLSSTYVPHCVDVDDTKPSDRDMARAWLGMPDDKFIFGMVANNVGVPSRKSFSEVFAALQKAVEVNPNIHLYLHSEARPGAIGVDLVHLSQLFDVETHVSFTNPDHFWTSFGSDEAMNALYTAFDCLLIPSQGEGFGVPIIEAQACGTPVITQAVTAMTELTHYGTAIPAGHAWLTPQMSYQWQPDPEDIAAAMLNAARGDYENESTPEQAREWVAANYDIRVVRDRYWAPLVERLAEQVAAREEMLEPVEALPV